MCPRAQGGLKFGLGIVHLSPRCNRLLLVLALLSIVNLFSAGNATAVAKSMGLNKHHHHQQHRCRVSCSSFASMEKATTVGAGRETDRAYKLNKASDPVMLEPWPPFKASTYFRFSKNTILSAAGRPRHALLGPLESNLRTKYPELFYFLANSGVGTVNPGVAIVTPLERIDDDGVPINENRFGPRRPAGRYRFIIFVLSPDASHLDQVPDGLSRYSDLVSKGAKSLNDDIRLMRTPSNDKMIAHIYEFVISNDEATFVPESSVSGAEHLARSGIVTGPVQ